MSVAFTDLELSSTDPPSRTSTTTTATTSTSSWWVAARLAETLLDVFLFSFFFNSRIFLTYSNFPASPCFGIIKKYTPIRFTTQFCPGSQKFSRKRSDPFFPIVRKNFHSIFAGNILSWHFKNTVNNYYAYLRINCPSKYSETIIFRLTRANSKFRCFIIADRRLIDFFCTEVYLSFAYFEVRFRRTKKLLLNEKILRRLRNRSQPKFKQKKIEGIMFSVKRIFCNEFFRSIREFSGRVLWQIWLETLDLG